MNIKIDWFSTIAALLTTGVILIFPFINPCSDDLLLCKTTIDDLTLVDYYGLKLYLP